MTEQNSEDWLPSGWTVEVKVRNNGTRRDKYYYDTSSGHRFNSRVEVSRYLGTPREGGQKNKETLKQSAEDVVVEKTIAEGLPPGWIKEIRMTKKAHKIRRDTFYIAPVSQKVFRSLKEVRRYLENEKPRRISLEPTDSSDKELEDEHASKLGVSSTKRQINFDQSSNLNGIMKDGLIPNRACNGESPPLPQHISDQSEVGTESGSLNTSEAKGAEQKEQGSDSTKSECTAIPAGGGPQDKQSLQSGLIKHESKNTQLGLGKSKKKKGVNLPGRASKRLAGLEVDPVPELKTSTRASRAGIKQSGEGVCSVTKGSSGNSAGCAFQQPDYIEVEPEKPVKKVEPVINGDDEQKEQRSDSTKSECISIPAGVGPPPDKQSLQSGLMKIESKKSELGQEKSKKKKGLNLPGRASKRLAGLEVDPVPELRTTTRARRAETKQSGEGVCSVNEGSSLGNSASCAFQQPDYLEVEPEKPVEKVEPVINHDEKQTEQGNSTKSECFSIPAGGDPQDKHESEKIQLGLGKSKKKKGLNLPRRASKRLAGLDVDPVTELKTSTQARRAEIKQSGEGICSVNEGSSSGNSAGCAFQQPDYLEVEPEKPVEKVEPVINGDEKQRSAVFPMGSRSTLEEHAGKFETDGEPEEKPGLQPDLPLGDFLTDPCIAFAIETLTGIAFDNSRSNSEHSSGDLVTPKDHSGNLETDNKSIKKQEGNVSLPLGEHGGKVGTDNKAEQKSASQIELPLGGSWPDPCIDFAVKTLTGAIPMDCDPHIEEYFQQQLSSSRIQGNSDLTLKNVGLDNFCQTDVLCQQFCDVEIPLLKNQAFSETRNASLHGSGSDLHEKGRDTVEPM